MCSPARRQRLAQLTRVLGPGSETQVLGVAQLVEINQRWSHQWEKTMGFQPILSTSWFQMVSFESNQSHVFGCRESQVELLNLSKCPVDINLSESKTSINLSKLIHYQLDQIYFLVIYISESISKYINPISNVHQKNLQFQISPHPWRFSCLPLRLASASQLRRPPGVVCAAHIFNIAMENG